MTSESAALTVVTPAALDVEVAKPKRPFHVILGMMQASDDNMLEEEIDLEELGKELRDKVDNIVEFTDACYARGAAIAKRAAELSAKAAAFNNKADRLLEYVHRNMVETGSLELPGHDFAFRIKYSERVDIKPTAIADPGMYLRFSRKAAGLIKRTYAWDKNVIKRLLKAGDADIAALASITKHPNLEIKPKA